MQKENEYRTSDLGAATYIVSVGEQILRADFSNPKRVIFCFRNTPSVSKAVEDYWNGKARVEPLHLLQNQKLLKQRIYSHSQP